MPRSRHSPSCETHTAGACEDSPRPVDLCNRREDHDVVERLRVDRYPADAAVIEHVDLCCGHVLHVTGDDGGQPRGRARKQRLLRIGHLRSIEPDVDVEVGPNAYRHVRADRATDT